MTVKHTGSNASDVGFLWIELCDTKLSKHRSQLSRHRYQISRHVYQLSRHMYQVSQFRSELAMRSMGYNKDCKRGSNEQRSQNVQTQGKEGHSTWRLKRKSGTCFFTVPVKGSGWL